MVSSPLWRDVRVQNVNANPNAAASALAGSANALLANVRAKREQDWIEGEEQRKRDRVASNETLFQSLADQYMTDEREQRTLDQSGFLADLEKGNVHDQSTGNRILGPGGVTGGRQLDELAGALNQQKQKFDEGVKSMTPADLADPQQFMTKMRTQLKTKAGMSDDEIASTLGNYMQQNWPTVPPEIVVAQLEELKNRDSLVLELKNQLGGTGSSGKMGKDGNLTGVDYQKDFSFAKEDFMEHMDIEGGARGWIKKHIGDFGRETVFEADIDALIGEALQQGVSPNALFGTLQGIMEEGTTKDDFNLGSEENRNKVLAQAAAMQGLQQKGAVGPEFSGSELLKLAQAEQADRVNERNTILAQSRPQNTRKSSALLSELSRGNFQNREQVPLADAAPGTGQGGQPTEAEAAIDQLLLGEPAAAPASAPLLDSVAQPANPSNRQFGLPQTGNAPEAQLWSDVIDNAINDLPSNKGVSLTERRTLQAAQNKNPEQIRQMIKQNPDPEVKQVLLTLLAAKEQQSGALLGGLSTGPSQF
jgi:hypothetical protein